MDVLSKSKLFLLVLVIICIGCSQNPTATDVITSTEDIDTPAPTNTELLPTATETPIPEVIRLAPSPGYIFIRDCPSTRCDLVFKVEKNSEFVITAHNEKDTERWYQVEYEKDKFGWVAVDYRVEVAEGAWERVPLLTTIPMSTPAPTKEPTVVVKNYHIDIGVKSNSTKVWMPIPRYWDGNGLQKIKIEKIYPEPNDWYRDDSGTEILYWENYSGGSQDFGVVFDVELIPTGIKIDPEKEIPPYDKNTYLYREFTASDNMIQSNSEEIVEQANKIIGSETNPYKQAKSIHQWMASNISSEPGPRDAVSVLRNRHCQCGGRAFLFVALCRAVGIPARPIAGIHSPGSYDLKSGNWYPDKSMGYHIWAEFYIPEYGWIQVDPGNVKQFNEIEEDRLITSKGNHIKLGHGSRHNEILWFHLPYDTNSQIEHLPLWFNVSKSN